MPPPAIVAELVERFDDHLDQYRSGGYNEAQLRQEFLNPLLEALGWDVYNKHNYAEAYKEVIHEASIKMGGRTKAPDYALRAGGGVTSLFVEAKKPSVDIRGEPATAYQLRRYAWSAKLPVSVLTDFEEFAVYDCRVRPIKTDRASTARIIYHTYDQYEQRWDEIYGLFSPEAIRHGALDKFIAGKKIKKGTEEVDDAFLDEIESWRTLLARNMALRNKDLSQRDLNFAVQRTIDRIIFLRICEDRGIEPYGRLGDCANGPDIYRRLAQLFQGADDRYNSGLFHFQPERDRPGDPDEWTLGLSIDDGPLRTIIRHLYYPDSPYEFAVLPAEILGHVYEQFLGKVIRLTKGHQAKVEEKPEVKKAGGVYYTPKYIVDYIVQNTVGKLLGGERAEGRGQRAVEKAESGKQKGEDRLAAAGTAASASRDKAESRKQKAKGMTPGQAAKLRILDPACGSGSFLIGAYQYLLDWHRDWYTRHEPEKHAKGRTPKLYRSGATGATAGSSGSAQRSRSNNTAGQAGSATPSGDWRLTTAEKKRILLNNIYGVDIDSQAVEVTKLSLLLKVLEGESQETLSNQLRLFHERALPDLSTNIKCGNSLIGSDFYKDKQQTLFDEDELYRINAFDWENEFPDIFKGKNPGFDAVIGNPPYLFITEVPQDMREYYQQRYEGVSYRFDLYGAFIERSAVSLLNDSGVFGFIIPHTLLSNDSFRGLRALLTTRTTIYQVVDFGPGVFRNAKNETMLLFFVNRKPAVEARVEIRGTSPKTFPSDCERFAATQVAWAKKDGSPWLVHVSEEKLTAVKRLASASHCLGDFCTANQGLRTGNNKKYLADEPRGGTWKHAAGGKHVGRYMPLRKEVFVRYERDLLDAPRREEIFISPEKIVVQEVRNISLERRIVATLDTEKTYCLQSTNVINIKEPANVDIRYVLGVLNSNAANFYFRCSFPGNNHIPSNQLLRIPVPEPQGSDAAAQMVELVDRMLSLHKGLSEAKTSHDKEVLKRQIDATDCQIDRLVYELYELTDEEIAIVEKATTEQT